MVLLLDVGRVETRFCPFGDIVNLNTREMHDLCRTYHRLRKSFWMHLIVLVGDVDQVEAHFDLFGEC
jgi:hypothetical protein